MNNSSKRASKIIIILLAILMIAFSIYSIFWLTKHPISPEYSGILYPIIVGLFFSTIPVYMILYKLYSKISNRFGFQLTQLKPSVIVLGLVFIIMMPFIYQLADRDDAPGMILLGMIPIILSATFYLFISKKAK